MSKKITLCHIRTVSSWITSTFNVIVRHNSIKYSRKFELFLGFCVNLKLIFKQYFFYKYFSRKLLTKQ